MAIQTRLTNREQQNLANWLSELSRSLKQAIERQDWESVDRIAKALDTEATNLTHRIMGLI